MKNQFVVDQRIVYEGVSKEGGIPKMYITEERLTDVKQFWRFSKAFEAERKGRQTTCERGVEKYRIVKKLRMLRPSTITNSKLTIETLEQDVKYGQS